MYLVRGRGKGRGRARGRDGSRGGGERVVPAEHDVLGVGDLVREEDVELLGAPVPLELHLRRLPGGRPAQI